MKINVGISNRHVHLTEDDFKILFNQDELTKRNDLSQPGEFASNEIVTIATPKSKIEKVRVLGPLRNYTQVEISKTDSIKLGINPPVRNSGDLNDAETITIIGPNGKIERKSCIIATRHIHITKEEKERLGLNDIVKIKISSEKGATLENVYVKDHPNYKYELHLDTDDANSNFLKQNDEVEIIN